MTQIKMIFLHIFIVSCLLFGQGFNTANADVSQQAKLAVLLQPSYQSYDFSNANHLKLSDFKNLILAANGISIKNPIAWNGLVTSDSLQVPKVTLLFLVDSGHVDISSMNNNKVILVDQDSTSDFSYLKTSVTNSEVKFYDEIPSQFDLKSVEQDCSKDSLIYVYQTSNSDVKTLSDQINHLVGNLTANCATIVNQKTDLLVYLLSIDESHSNRVKRQAPSNNKILNLAVFYSDQYPAMFNLIFWTSLILALTVAAIAYGMCNMDPGLNTVIYRMTSQRLKKEQ